MVKKGIKVGLLFCVVLNGGVRELGWTWRERVADLGVSGNENGFPRCVWN